MKKSNGLLAIFFLSMTMYPLKLSREDYVQLGAPRKVRWKKVKVKISFV